MGIFKSVKFFLENPDKDWQKNHRKIEQLALF